MRRRRILAATLAAYVSASTRVSGQSATRMLRVGDTSLQQRNDTIIVSFVNRMAELGYVEDRNFVFDFVRVSTPNDFGAAYVELIKRGADILLARGSEPVLRAARDAAAGKVPIVFVAVDYDPFAQGYVSSLARPGGNLTGIFVRQIELAQKRIELAHEMLPGARRLALWWDFASRDQAEAGLQTARAVGVEGQLLEVGGQPPDHRAAFDGNASGDPIIVPASPIFFRDRAKIGALSLERRIPTVAAFRELVQNGSLMSYGVNLAAVARYSASYVDRIAHGAKPADLPVEQPTSFDLAINQRTAAILGIPVPASLTARADEVIE
jgi:putative ABC transport system substrate-binding protein